MYSPGFCHTPSSCPRYGLLAGSRPSSLEQREGCAAVLAHVVGNPSDLYQIGATKVMPTENPICTAQPDPPIPRLAKHGEELSLCPKREGLAHLPLSPLPLVSSTKEAFLALQINRRCQLQAVVAWPSPSYTQHSWASTFAACWPSSLLDSLSSPNTSVSVTCTCASRPPQFP